ncbi:hypothetical protein HK405_011952 [Cladochytrium tenue]|nr:hypothetical protein HK405_011952 [Cladochytrium tenue]
MAKSSKSAATVSAAAASAASSSSTRANNAAQGPTLPAGPATAPPDATTFEAQIAPLQAAIVAIQAQLTSLGPTYLARFAPSAGPSTGGETPPSLVDEIRLLRKDLAQMPKQYNAASA